MYLWELGFIASREYARVEFTCVRIRAWIGSVINVNVLPEPRLETGGGKTPDRTGCGKIAPRRMFILLRARSGCGVRG